MLIVPLIKPQCYVGCVCVSVSVTYTLDQVNLDVVISSHFKQKRYSVLHSTTNPISQLNFPQGTKLAV